eukprot:Sspe_Gene.32555::Locus_15945_Transcript_1_1_Confidence_1.000_Length_1102::g.32555::m.32555/K18416/THEX1, ERI1; 3'-5' exoribonuclease 1
MATGGTTAKGDGSAYIKNSYECLALPGRPREAPRRKTDKGRKKPNLAQQPFDYFLVFDFEATCEKNVCNYPHEIIEFPIVAVSADGTIGARFHSYVRPVKNPVLTEFCTSLTGITQDKVDAAPTLPEVLLNVDAWIQSTFQSSDRLIFASDGPWDLRDFLWKKSVLEHGLREVPSYLYQWVNLRSEFARVNGVTSRGIKGMLGYYKMTFNGRPHSGIDDAMNLAAVLVRMLHDGHVIDRVQSLSDDIIEQLPDTLRRQAFDLKMLHRR